MHSPGPWKWEEQRDGTLLLVDSRGEDILGAGVEIAEGWLNGACAPDEDNARLIAAAPDLLALARYAVERGEGDSDMAAALIARIEGKP